MWRIGLAFKESGRIVLVDKRNYLETKVSRIISYFDSIIY